MKNVTKNIMYIAQELHIFYNHLELNYKSPLDLIFLVNILLTFFN